MRTLLSSVLAVSLALPALAFAEEFSFSDVPFTHPNAEAIEYLKAENIVHGYPDGTFKPDTTINRAEFTKIIMDGYNATDSTPSQCGRSDTMYLPFSDVHNGDWFAFRVCIAAAEGVVSGYPDGTFRPAANINFAEAAKIIVKSFGLEASSTIPACEGDCPWYRSYVLMLEMKAAIPTSINAFDRNITRGEMAEMIWRLKTGNNDKPSRTYEDLARGDTVRAYRNDDQKLSFDYPISYSVVEDGVFHDYPETPDWYRIELTGVSNGWLEKPSLTVEVNPDGYGPIFSDTYFTMAENEDGSIRIVEREDSYNEYSSTDDMRIIVASSMEARNGNTYYWRFTYPSESQNIDEVFLDILASARIGK